MPYNTVMQSSKETEPDSNNNSKAFVRAPQPFSMQLAMALTRHAGAAAQSGHYPDELVDIIAGIKKYHEHFYQRDNPALPAVWQVGEVTLRHCASGKDEAPALLLVPSLVNRSYIFDLMPAQSFVRWLSSQGIDVYLLDWGRPVQDESLANAGTLTYERLQPALSFVQERHAETFALGYCMGGTLLSAAAQNHQNDLSGLVFLATPWDFKADTGKLGFYVRHAATSALPLMQQRGYLPGKWIQSVFAAANAACAAEKFAAFAHMEPESESACLFVAVEDWLNDSVDLPEGIAKTCLLDWYRDNKIVRGQWRVNDAVVNPAQIKTPSLVIVSRKDNLVPPESSLPLYDALPYADILKTDSGHIGMMTGRKAQKTVWEEVCGWIKKTGQCS